MDEHTRCGKLGPGDVRDKIIVELRKELEETKSDLAVTTQMLVWSLRLTRGPSSASDLEELRKALR